MHLTDEQIKQKCQKQLQCKINDSVYNLNSNSSRDVQYAMDSQFILNEFIKAVLKKFPDQEFDHFYDQEFLKISRQFIKDKELFTRFIEQTGVQIQYFVRLSAMALPQMFTTHLIKFFKQNYLR